jgi:hypothetical protein
MMCMSWADHRAHLLTSPGRVVDDCVALPVSFQASIQTVWRAEEVQHPARKSMLSSPVVGSSCSRAQSVCLLVEHWAASEWSSDLHASTGVAQDRCLFAKTVMPLSTPIQNMCLFSAEVAGPSRLFALDGRSWAASLL